MTSPVKASRPGCFLTFIRQHAAQFPVKTLARHAKLSRSTVVRVLAGGPTSVPTLEALLQGLGKLGVKAELLVVLRQTPP